MRWLLHALDLASDQAAPGAIDATLRAGASFRGTNLWLLGIAIVIASVGLNVNSAAVIIGAMLISPLMGPIMAIGYGAAVNDLALVRSALRELALAVAFSLFASTLYFLVTPLSEARSELLARTSPTIWDVAIALFGGFAGMLGATRKERSNVLPGVAIATALMPPLCTAGFGLATAQWSFFLGALYLFSINSVFIATATMLMARLARLPEIANADETARTRARRAIGLVVLVTASPSLWLAADLVRQEVFMTRAEQFLADAFPSGSRNVAVAREIDAREREIRVTVVGPPIGGDVVEALEAALPSAGLAGARLHVAEVGRAEVDVAALRASLSTELHQSTLTVLEERTREIETLRFQLARAEEQTADRETRAEAWLNELATQLPEATEIHVGEGLRRVQGAEPTRSLVVAVTTAEPLSRTARERLAAWLRLRTGFPDVQIVVSSPESRHP
jgi:uncharacterized hydrophobic protein (TIGR00271 family)